MDQIKMKKQRRHLHFGRALPSLWIWALVVLGLILCALAAGERMQGADLALALVLTGAAVGLCQGLRRLGDGRLGFLGVMVLAAVLSYMCVELVSLGTISWRNEEIPMLHLVGFPWVLAVFLLAYAAVGRTRIALAAGNLILAAFAVVSYALMVFRERTLLAADLFSLRIAMSVADHYDFPWEAHLFLGLGLWVVSFVLCWALAGPAPGREPARPGRGFRITSRLLCVGFAAVYAFCFYGTYMLARSGLWLRWDENDFAGSPLTNFMYSIRQLGAQEPEDYSQENLAALTGDTEGLTATGEEQPHVIVIMSEAYSDLSVLGDFETSEEIAPYFHSLWENSVHGYAYSSVFGGNTANSEYEFLTGNSLAFEGSSTVPYQTAINYEKDTLVSTLKAQGYSATALHPYGADGWNRVQVYDLFGFDETHFIDDWVKPKKLRGYITDESDFDKLIELFEEREPGEKQFLFNITMQNHGNYNTENFNPTVTITGHEGEFPLAEQYLSLLQVTDAALQELIEYFSAVEEPVMLVFFGDHQPRLDDEFYDYVFGEVSGERSALDRQKQYLVPFLIWKNYEEDSRDLGTTSLNYLGQLALQEAGLATTPFGAWLLELREEYPTINAYGYTEAGNAADTGGWNPLPTNLEELPERLQQYWMLQYNYLHDAKGYDKAFFGTVGPAD